MIYSGKFNVTSPFGVRVLNGSRQDHKGIDVVGLADKHVCAVVSGTVAVSAIITDRSNRTWEWGNYVRVDGDDGRKYYYCHLAGRLVSVGQRVKIGDHIGIEGNTGSVEPKPTGANDRTSGRHCHFEVRDRSGKSIDPAPFLGIVNACGTYGTDYRAACAAKFGLSEQTMQYLDGYKFAADLYRKLVTK